MTLKKIQSNNSMTNVRHLKKSKRSYNMCSLARVPQIRMTVSHVQYVTQIVTRSLESLIQYFEHPGERALVGRI